MWFPLAIYGVLFQKQEEAAFSNYRLWESMGFIIAYLNTNLICVDAKLYALLAILTLGMMAYLILELTLWNSKRVASVPTPIPIQLPGSASNKTNE